MDTRTRRHQIATGPRRLPRELWSLVAFRRSVRGAPDLARPLETANEPLARGYRRDNGAIRAGGQPHLHLHPWRPPHDMAVVHGELLTVRQLAAVKPAMPGGSKAAEEATLGAALARAPEAVAGRAVAWPVHVRVKCIALPRAARCA